MKTITNMRSLIRAFASALDLIEPELQDHHEKVALLAVHLGRQLRFSDEQLRITFYGGLMHDIGAIMLQNDVSLRELELRPTQLAKAGAALLRKSPDTSFLADAVATTQSPWLKLKDVRTKFSNAQFVPQVIHLADTVALLIKDDEPVLNQLDEIRTVVHNAGEREFSPDVLEAFDAVCGHEIIWFNMQYRPSALWDDIPDQHDVSITEALRLTEFMSRIIDFRSPFTAMHSAGVAASAEYLAELFGMSVDECHMVRIAGNLHDVGKLKTPTAILEKPAKLTDNEFNVMKEHAFYSHTLLREVAGFEEITLWAALHHEKLNGTGYPFHLGSSEIPLGSRIMAVADVFSAITEDRPYRRGMEPHKAIEVLRGDAARGALTPAIVELLIQNYDSINERRAIASRNASRRYQEALEGNIS